ncbi:MAG: thio(seleno)oxazole modification radical SAM maturase SbtM [Syntrophales bacterium]|nr:thio(seleno)oxazole modification radical SAM maturase SbtM [Syntrophales bacterium]
MNQEQSFLSELSRLERSIRKVEEQNDFILDRPESIMVNPTLHLLQLHWKNLTDYLKSPGPDMPAIGDEFVIIWKDPADARVRAQTASPEQLLVLKMISENINCREVARIGAVPVRAVDAAMERAAEAGIIFVPPSRIRREHYHAEMSPYAPRQFLVSPTFTLQWHITQACDLHCRHCYDRSARSAFTIEQAQSVLDDLDDFCRSRHVKGHISFTGGNPLLHPDFPAIYRSAADHGFTLAVLGNPSVRTQLEELIAIQPPDFFQVSLEGLSEYNDYIRGKGHFEKTMDFLGLIREMNIYSMVMLTLTKGNVHQVIPLGERLREKADVFYFNRLSQVGEGAALELPSREEYRLFLGEYLEAAKTNPVLGLKDNLINVSLHCAGAPPFGGCTGFGCGAAFNFLSVLSDGEVHACRKFPSAIGNVLTQHLEEIYDSDIARRYRSGCAECEPCPLKPVCGGCLACAYSHKLDVFEKKDPYCFRQMD